MPKYQIYRSSVKGCQCRKNWDPIGKPTDYLEHPTDYIMELRKLNPQWFFKAVRVLMLLLLFTGCIISVNNRGSIRQDKGATSPSIGVEVNKRDTLKNKK